MAGQVLCVGLGCAGAGLSAQCWLPSRRPSRRPSSSLAKLQTRTHFTGMRRRDWRTTRLANPARLGCGAFPPSTSQHPTNAAGTTNGPFPGGYFPAGSRGGAAKPRDTNRSPHTQRCTQRRSYLPARSSSATRPANTELPQGALSNLPPRRQARPTRPPSALPARMRGIQQPSYTATQLGYTVTQLGAPSWAQLGAPGAPGAQQAVRRPSPPPPPHTHTHPWPVRLVPLVFPGCRFRTRPRKHAREVERARMVGRWAMSVGHVVHVPSTCSTGWARGG
jgi:hypothetical protein